MERDQGLALELNTEQSSVQARILTVMVPGSLGRCLPNKAAEMEWQGMGHITDGWVGHSLGPHLLDRTY